MKILKNPKLQYMKISNNFYVYVPRGIIRAQKLKQGELLNIKKWAEAIEKGEELE